MANKPLKIPPELEDVAAQIGDFVEYFGFKNVHGRIWTHLFLAGEPLDAGDLIERVGISKALVSMSIADLIAYDVIRMLGKSSRGTVLYGVNHEVTNVITNILRKRERRMLGRIGSAVRLLKEAPSEEGPALASTRITSLQEMVETAARTLDSMLLLSTVSFEGFASFNDIEPDAPAKPSKPKS